MGTETVNRKERWLHLFEEEYFCYEKGTVQHDVALILKNMLLSTEPNTAAPATAHQLSTYYWARNNEKGPFLSWGETKEPSADFISFLADIIVRVSALIPYTDVKQDALTLLIFELHNLPPNPIPAWNGDRLISPDDTIFADTLYDNWEIFRGGNLGPFLCPPDWKLDGDEWANFSSFLARCIQSRVDNHLEVKEGRKKLELSMEGKEAVAEAKKRMVSLRPELFFVSEGGSKPDV